MKIRELYMCTNIEQSTSEVGYAYFRTHLENSIVYVYSRYNTITANSSARAVHCNYPGKQRTRTSLKLPKTPLQHASRQIESPVFGSNFCFCTVFKRNITLDKLS